jgi:hypothetical protein
MSVLRSPEDLTVFFFSDLIHLDSTWIPGGFHMSPYGFCIELWVEVFFRWTPSGLQMDLWSPGGLHLESVGEGKLH